jgi:hypothetical protein
MKRERRDRDHAVTIGPTQKNDVRITNNSTSTVRVVPRIIITREHGGAIRERERERESQRKKNTKRPESVH